MNLITDTLILVLTIGSPLIAVLGTIILIWVIQNHNKPSKKHWDVR